MIESSPAASLRGLIGHELQCLQRNVWDRRFSAERCVGFEASYFSYNCFVKMDASNPCFFSVHVFVVPLYVWYYFLPIHHSLWSADCLGDSFALKKWSRVCHRRSAPSLYEMQWSPGASGRLGNTWATSKKWWLEEETIPPHTAGWTIPGPLPFVDTSPRKWTNHPQEMK